MRHPDAREEQAQIIVHFGDRADGRTRIARSRLLVDGDRRRQALDVVDVRLLHLSEKLARVRGERFDVAALAFRIDRVEGKRRFAGPREAGDDDQAVSRKGEIDVFEVMLARALDNDGVETGWHVRYFNTPPGLYVAGFS